MLSPKADFLAEFGSLNMSFPLFFNVSQQAESAGKCLDVFVRSLHAIKTNLCNLISDATILSSGQKNVSVALYMST